MSSNKEYKKVVRENKRENSSFLINVNKHFIKKEVKFLKDNFYKLNLNYLNSMNNLNRKGFLNLFKNNLIYLKNRDVIYYNLENYNILYDEVEKFLKIFSKN